MDDLSNTLHALADPTRRSILARLSKGETTLSKLAEPFDMSIPAVAKHLKVLEGAGLVCRGPRGPTRPIRLQARALREVSQWVERYREFWDGSLDRLGAYLDRSAEARKHGRK
jgi:DNA-binding transcriptional ArsR family regulator